MNLKQYKQTTVLNCTHVFESAGYGGVDGWEGKLKHFSITFSNRDKLV